MELGYFLYLYQSQRCGLMMMGLSQCKKCGGSMQPGKAPYQIHEWSDPSAPGGIFRMGVLINRLA